MDLFVCIQRVGSKLGWVAGLKMLYIHWYRDVKMAGNVSAFYCVGSAMLCHSGEGGRQGF